MLAEVQLHVLGFLLRGLYIEMVQDFYHSPGLRFFSKCACNVIHVLVITLVGIMNTVKPLFSGHPWDKTICPLNGGVLNMEVALHLPGNNYVDLYLKFQLLNNNVIVTHFVL